MSVFVIGAKSDIAKATAKKYAKKGHDLILAGRNISELESLVSDINIRYNRSVKLIEVDILNYNTHKTLYQSIKDEIDTAICFVGYLGEQELSQENFDEARLILDSNYTGVTSILNEVATDFEKRKTGSIVCVSSVAGDRGRQSNYSYGAAKAALNTYLSGLRNRLYKSNVHVLTVKPGFVNTKMTAHLDLPNMLTAAPEKVADDIYNAQKKKKNVLYTKWMWYWIMLIIRNIPESIFKKMNL